MRSKSFILMVLFLLVACGFFAGNAFALGVGSNVSQDKPGQALVFGYYDTRSEANGGAGLTDNYFTVTNTSEYYTQAHVRVRTGDCSVELLDFDVMLTPYDVFGFDIYQQEGHIVFASCDTHTLEQSGFTLNYDASMPPDGVNDCYMVTSDPASAAYFPNLTSLIKACGNCATGAVVTEAEAVTQALKGYAEVIGEGDFEIDPAHPILACRTAPAPGTTLYDWNVVMGCNVFNAYPPHLMGKVYYADTDLLWPASISRLGDLNAYAIQWFIDGSVILHKNTYPAELAVPTGPGYAYDAAKVAPDGANDINMCFYNTGAGVLNRVGAAATYGPTLADVDYDLGTAYNGRQDIGFPVPYRATVAQVDSLTNDLFGGVADGSTWCMVGGVTAPCYSHGTGTAMSHFFNFAPLMKSSFVFTFPTKHFINQQIQVRELTAFNTEEDDCIIPPGKFISPGLPGAPTYAQEVSITTPTTCPAFAEGWRSYGFNVISDAVGNQLSFHDYYGDGFADDRVVSVTGYSPLALTFEMTTGADIFSTSPMTKDPASVSILYWSDN